jgi:hypothetical protein
LFRGKSSAFQDCAERARFYGMRTVDRNNGAVGKISSVAKDGVTSSLSKNDKSSAL